MIKKPIILIGAGGHAESCIDLINEQKEFKLKEIIGTKKELNKMLLNEFKVKFDDRNLRILSKKYKYALIGIGQIHSNKIRKQIFAKLKSLKFILPTVCSKHSIISKYCSIGEGTIVMHGAIISANVKIGKNCIINSNALIEHGCLIEDNVHIATSATINSGVTIGQNSFVGSGTVIRQSVKVKKNSFIKMHSTIKR